jgi:hypothetical protein
MRLGCDSTPSPRRKDRPDNDIQRGRKASCTARLSLAFPWTNYLFAHAAVCNSSALARMFLKKVSLPLFS